MSEPYCAMARLHLEPAALGRYLAAAPRPLAEWADRAGLTGWHDRRGEDGGLPWSLHPGPDEETVARWLADGDDHRAQLRAFLRTAEEPGLARVDYDAGRGVLTVVNLTVHRESFRDPLWFLALVRAAAPETGPAGGFAVVRDHIWPGPRDRYTLGVLALAPAGARVLHPVADAAAYAAAVRAADAEFEATGQVGEDDDPEEWNGPDPVEALDRL
ncbi:hypothetical protein ACIQBJ_07585 [Kitasatospora sp. NPDC088391]|uniref:hypothetical protein n=1 Tax=Kitasatospora sp. NPDC088391 TaxID=3364074 RepID=UPI00380B797C